MSEEETERLKREMLCIAWYAAFAAVEEGYPKINWAAADTLADIAFELNELVGRI